MDKPIHIGDEPVHLEAHVSAPQFTCLSCLIGFPDGDAQRAHYRSDHHRYNMKRRVAGLPPISTLAFNQKVLDKRAETALTTADRGATCEVCNKVYSTENAYRSHIISKKHRENELKIALQPTTSAPVSGEVPSAPEAYGGGSSTIAESSTTPANATSAPSANKDEDDSSEDMEEDEDENEQTLDEKLAAARSRIGPTSCLFCPVSSPTAPENIEHMAKVHSFFIPDAAYVEDLPGLITYLAEKLAIGNACLHCNREFRDLHAVRKHMSDKSHLKIAYDTERQRLEISDFYDFTSSYPDADAAGNARRNRTARKTITAASANADEEWESDEDEENVTVGDDESVYDVESESDEDEDELAANNLEYGDTPYELVLPSGARIGHRSMSRYYKQSFSSPLPQKHAVKEGAAPSGRELVHRILAEKDGVLVPAHGGGFGAFGKGTQVIKARNRGEAKEAGRHVREFRDQNRREQFKTKVGFIANSQKHFRDPLLQ